MVYGVETAHMQSLKLAGPPFLSKLFPALLLWAW